MIIADIRKHMHKLRDAAACHYAPLDHEKRTNIISTEIRRDCVNDVCVNRLLIFMRGSGCQWAKVNGGCTFCGFWDMTNFSGKISNQEYLSQIYKVLLTSAFLRSPIVCLYNDGSILVEEEISLDVVVQICNIISSYPHVQKIVLESKIIDITEEKIKAIQAGMNGKQLEISVGFESANPLIRSVCVNKEFTPAIFEEKSEILKRLGVHLTALLMLKPPFITELQAIEDAVNSLKYLEWFSLNRINFELATIEENTLMYDLWKSDLYTTPWIWSMIEILKRRQQLDLKTIVYVSPPNYTAKAFDYSKNCPFCNEIAIEALFRFNQTHDIKEFDNLDCACKEKWNHILKKQEVYGDFSEHQAEDIFKELIS